LIGLALGLFIVAAGLTLLASNLREHRAVPVLLEARLMQDLCTAADLIVRDLRRAAYWQKAHLGMSTDALVAPLPNNYSAIANPSATEVSYSYAKDDDNIRETAEEFGVQREVETVGGVNRGVLQLKVAGTWRTITDPATLDIPAANGLTITSSAHTNELWDACPCLGELTCRPGQFKDPDTDPDATTLPSGAGVHFANRPRLDIRQYALVLRADSVATPTFSREISETVRVRNDAVQGVCP